MIVGMESKIDLNPQTKVVYDEDWKPHYEFDGYDISPEDIENNQMYGRDSLK